MSALVKKTLGIAPARPWPALANGDAHERSRTPRPLRLRPRTLADVVAQRWRQRAARRTKGIGTILASDDWRRHTGDRCVRVGRQARSSSPTASRVRWSFNWPRGARTFRSEARLLVAPADVDDPSWATPAIGSFGPMPLQRLPFPSIVVASRSDPYLNFNRAEVFARCWNSGLRRHWRKGPHQH